jgi:hypothetical protein
MRTGDLPASDLPAALYRLESGSPPRRWLVVAAGDQERKVRHGAEHKERQPQEAKITEWESPAAPFTDHSLIKYSATAGSAALLVLLAVGCAGTTGGTGC